MRCVGIEFDEKKKPVLLIEEKKWFRRKITKYIAYNRITGNFYEWLELPEMIIVPDVLSFQLDVWLEQETEKILK